MSITDDILKANRGNKRLAGAVLAHGLMVGDKATLKLGYSRESAMIAVRKAYATTPEDEVAINSMLDFRLKQEPVSYGPEALPGPIAHSTEGGDTTDAHNLAEQTKGGQPRTAVGVTNPGGPAFQTPREVDEEREVGIMNEAGKATLLKERGQVARDTAIALGYTQEQAGDFQTAAEFAVGTGWPENKAAGRTSIGRRMTRFASGDRIDAISLSIVGPTGAHFDPTRPITPGNSLGGSD